MSDFIVVGGGLLGLLTASNLCQKGALVTLIEKGICGQESSWAGGGILTPLYPWKYPQAVQALSARSRRLYPALCQNLLAETGIDPEYRKTGMLLSGDCLLEAEAWCKTNNEVFEAGVYGDAGLCAKDSAWYEKLVGKPAFYLPEIAQVRNPRLVKALIASLGLSKCASIVEQCSIRLFEEKSSCIHVYDESGERYSADKLVFCTGAWTSDLLQSRLPKSIKPVKGQMLLYKGEPNRFPHMLLCNGRYVIPRLDGHVLVGSTMEDSGFKKNITPEAVSELAAFAESVSGCFGVDNLVCQWAGLRPGTDDGIPYIGGLPDSRRVFVCAGHYRNGVVTAPASVEQLMGVLF